MKILLLQLEFSRWKTAKPWTYTWNFGIAQALNDANIETFTIPAIPDQDLEYRMSWIGRVHELCHGMKFDQVWIWLPHFPYTQETLEWIHGIAPIRIGILVESMQYDEEDYLQAPHLRKRPDIIRKQAQYLTHILVGDENDVEPIASWGRGEVMWWPGGVPERFITPFANVVKHPCAVFHGTVYGKRHPYLSHHRLKNSLMFPNSDVYQSEFHQLFDEVQMQMEQSLKAGVHLNNFAELTNCLHLLAQVRFGEFNTWMQHLQTWAVIVNLPSYAKFYGGRVFEGIAAGRPIISWEIPSHPRNNALFNDGDELLLFRKDDFDSLANHIECLLADSRYASQLVLNAQRKLRKFHTIEKRGRDVLNWVKTGEEPYYETRSESAAFSLKTRNTARGCNSTSALSMVSGHQG